MTLIIFIIILGVLILSHEFGHFIVAKKTGMRVYEFGLGFPPRLFGIKWGETEYTLNLIPFGGFVRIEGEEGENPEDPRSFASKSPSRKAAVLIAGVFFNVILAYLLFAVISVAGTPIQLTNETAPDNVSNIRVVIASVLPDSPAQQAHIEEGDVITGLSAESDTLRHISHITAVQEFTTRHAGETVTLHIERNGIMQTIQSQLRSETAEDEGVLGVTLARIGTIQYPWYTALWKGAELTARSIYLTLHGFYDLLRIAISGGNAGQFIAGPVGIVSLVDQSLGFGTVFLLQLIALISINLAIINLVPFPALDGGRLFFLAIEVIRGKELNKQTTALANTIGFFVLIGLLVLITISDIQKLF